MELSDKKSIDNAVREALNAERSGGFNFDNRIRNELIMRQLGSAQGALPKAWKTGTTIVGMVYKDGVVLGADTRATGGSEVVDKNCEKIHYLAPNIYCCGAGTAADTEKTTDLIASNLELLRLSSGTPSRVVAALTMLKSMLYKYQGHIGAALILGGVDIHGSHLYSIHPHGSSQRNPYETMGSGSLAAMAVFEARYKEDMEESDAITLVRDAIRAGIFNDLGSGSNVDVTVIRKDGTTSQHRSYEKAAGNSDTYKAQFPQPSKVTIPLGTTFVIDEVFRPHKSIAKKPVNASSSANAMDVST